MRGGAATLHSAATTGHGDHISGCKRTSEQSVRGSAVRYQIKLRAKEFLLGHVPKGRQIMLDRVPDQSFIYDVGQSLSRILRRHESDRAECWPGARA